MMFALQHGLCDNVDKLMLSKPAKGELLRRKFIKTQAVGSVIHVVNIKSKT